MKIVLATGNQGKIREFQKMCDTEVVTFKELLGEIEIVEDAETFKGNALIKARAIYDNLEDKNAIVISDDSGISVPLLGGEPGVFSARYAGENASDKENLEKLVLSVKETGLERTPAYYTAAIAIVSERGEYVVHGWMHGEVLNHKRGDKGFGYDPMFVPTGYEETLGELEDEVKKSISHRAKALKLAKPIIKMLQR
ncbi:MAG TPA: RdgB/HAM1 family non-canonical purine NTP pyrophosphatase [Campylobacterales bacterium]|nr:RdgB/HAM1 family non-canonical purine NTP pyrophosphatase [Campylobacterales bacterium]